MSDLQRAPSWSLKDHLTADFGDKPMAMGTAICDKGLAVYTELQLQRYGFQPNALTKPRQLCKRCAKKAGVTS